jgi:ribosomal protein S18 acetylase RimI-like enzyme
VTTVERPSTDEADTVADLWVALAEDQREHGSHLKTGVNRSHIRESVIQHVVTDSLLVAREAESIVGFVMFSVESGVYEQDVRRGVVENLYVDPAKRGVGIGADLLTAAETALEERGCSVVSLDVLAGNEDARRFYERHGYEPHRVEMERTLQR